MKGSWLAYIISLSLLVIYVGCVLRLSTFYHADTGWQLYSIWAVRNGSAPDFLSSLRPGYLLNLPGALLFGINLYAWRCITWVCAWLALAVGLSGLSGERWWSARIILLVTLASVCGLQYTDYIFSYYNAPWILLALALGCYGYAERHTSARYQCIGMSAFGSCIALASFSNLALLPAGLCVLVLGYALSKHRSKAIWVSAVLVWGVAGWAYFDWLGVAEQLMAHHGRGGSALWETIIAQSSKLVTVVFWLIAGWACAALLWVVVIRRWQRPGYRQAAFLTCLILLLIIFGYFALLIKARAVEYITASSYYFLLVALPLLLFMIWRHMATSQKQLLRMGIASIWLFALVHAATTQNPSFAIVSLYLPFLTACILLACWRYSVFSYATKVCTTMLVALMMVGMPWVLDMHSVGFWMAYNRYQGPLGMHMTERQSALMTRAQIAYHKYQCGQRWFFSFYDMPEWYVLFGRRAPFDQSWVSRIVFYPRNAQITAAHVMAEIKHQTHWCVLYAPAYDWYSKGYADKDLHRAVEWIQLHSQLAIPLGYNQSDDPAFVTLYVR